jgi:regulator of protease activity HflC (stomatin/prohibitin superfamily)
MNQVKEFLEYVFNVFKIWIIVQPWEQGIRVRCGNKTKRLYSGIYFRIPYLDSTYVQECRIRSMSICLQTLTTKDLKTVTINSALVYQIVDVEKLYKTLYHPEATISNMAMSEISDFVFKNNLTDVNPQAIEKWVMSKLKADDFGLKFEALRITNFASVRTFRLIQDGQSWTENRIDMNEKK